MVAKKVKFYSSIGLEPWDYRNPGLYGIGGSETSHIEMVQGLHMKMHRDVDFESFCPTDKDSVKFNVPWKNFKKSDPKDEALWIVYRDPTFFDSELNPHSKHWFIAQDVDYAWTPERLAKVDRYWCLCPTHAAFTQAKYPSLTGRIYVTSNGINRYGIEQALKMAGVRQMNKCVYTSSPDRGLKFLLENWFRILEFAPYMECHVFYGFDNILKLVGDNSAHPLAALKNDLEGLMKQQGIIWRGRVNQNQLWREYATANIWYYPTDWPETSPLAGDTRIETLKGQVLLKDLVGREEFVYSCDAYGKLSISKIWGCEIKRNNAETVKLIYKRDRGSLSGKNMELTLTPDHEVMLSTGEYRQAGDLKPGDSIKAFTRRKNEFGNGYDTIGLTHNTYMPEHRFVASKILGRELLKGEVVDHLDKNRRNNSFENLVVWPSQSQHIKNHFARMTEEERAVYCLQKQEEYKKRWLGRDAEKKQWHAAGGLAANHTIIKVEKGIRQDVYCMQSDPDHNFIANELVVHNCISCMEAQALGAIPVTSNYWALKDNVQWGYKTPRPPQHGEMDRVRTIEYFKKIVNESNIDRRPMSEWALRTFDWNNFVEQWSKFIYADLA